MKRVRLLFPLLLIASMIGCQTAPTATPEPVSEVSSADMSIVQSQEPSYVSDSAPSSEPAVSQETPTVTIWCNAENKSILDAVKEYQKDKDFQIVVEEKGTVDYQKLKELTRTGQAPDIICMDQVYITAAANSGYLVELNPLGAEQIASQFTASCVEGVSVNGKLYGLPFDANTVAMFYNKDILKVVNARVPTTYAELLTVCRKIQNQYDQTITPYTVPFDGWNGNDNWCCYNFFTYLWRNGGEILTADQKAAAFQSDAGVQALQMYLELSKENYASAQYLHDDFTLGTVGMIDMGPWAFGNLIQNNDKFQGEVALLPVLREGIKPYSGLGLYGYCITSSSKLPEQAYGFIEYYTSNPQYQLAYCKEANLLPTLKSAYADEYFSSDSWKTMLQQLEYAKARPGVDHWTEIENVIAKAITEAMKGKTEPKEILASAAKKVNDLLSAS